jgi:hypothetical protein
LLPLAASIANFAIAKALVALYDALISTLEQTKPVMFAGCSIPGAILLHIG